MRIALIFFFFLYFSQVNTQDIPALDRSYGVNGSSIIPTKGFPWILSYSLNVDNLGRSYLSYGNLYFESDTNVNVTTSYDFQRIDENGILEDWGYSNSSETEIPISLDSVGFYWQSDNKVLRHAYNEIDSLPDTLIIYDLEFNEESRFPIPLGLQYRNFSQLNNYESQFIDSEGRLLLNAYGKIYRYYENGILDSSFGVDGCTIIREPNTYADSIWSSWFDHILIDGEKILYTNARENESGTFETTVTRINEDGSVDNSFGLQNGVTLDSIYVGYDIRADNSGGYIIKSTFADSLCQNNRQNFLKISESGEIEHSFGQDGYLMEEQRECFVTNLNLIQNNAGEYIIVTSEPIYNLDSIATGYITKLQRYTQAGEVDRSFGQDGTFELDLPNKGYFMDFDLDPEENLYLYSIDSVAYEKADNNIRIFKFEAESVWASISQEPENLNPSLKLFPNPTSNGITLHYEGPELENVSIEVVNMLGQRVGILERETIIPGSETYLDTYAYPSGQYYIRVIDREKALRLLEEKFMIIY